MAKIIQFPSKKKLPLAIRQEGVAQAQREWLLDPSNIDAELPHVWGWPSRTWLQNRLDRVRILAKRGMR